MWLRRRKVSIFAYINRDNSKLAYLAGGRMGLNDRIIADCLGELKQALPEWKSTIDVSFLTDRQKQLYLALLASRAQTLGL